MKKTIYTGLLFIWMGVIYYLSSQGASTSGNLSNGLLYNIAVFLRISNAEDFILKYGTAIRKLAHFAEYFVLGILMYLTIKQYDMSKEIVVSILLCIVYATIDELHQLFVEGRVCSALDILLDSVGSISSIFTIHLLKRKCCQEKKL